MSRMNSILSAIIVVLMLYPSFAQNKNLFAEVEAAEQQKIKMVIKNYQKALESDNQGMIESAILNIMSLKYHYPDYDYSSLIESLESLENNDESKSIRFMSYIVKDYLLYPDRYTWIDQVPYEFYKDFYAVIAKKVYEQVNK